MTIIQASIPLFFASLAIELVWTHRRGQRFSRLNDSIADISCGVMSQLAGIFDKALTLGVYVWVAAHASVQQWLPLIPAWPDRSALVRGDGALGFAVDAPALLSWAVTFFLVDLCYYWSHRMSHEVNLLWAGHVVHHQSEEYNLSVALRQATIGKLFTDESVYREFDGLVRAAERVASSVNNGKGSVGRLVNDPKMYNELEASLANLNAITSSLRKGEGSLGQLMNDPAFAKSLNQTTSNLETMTAKLNRGEGTAGKLLNDDALYKRLDGMTARLDTVLQQLNDGQGTAGQLLHDKQLYENMNGTVSEMRALIAEIKKDPKKYLNVKVSIF